MFDDVLKAIAAKAATAARPPTFSALVHRARVRRLRRRVTTGATVIAVGTAAIVVATAPGGVVSTGPAHRGPSPATTPGTTFSPAPRWAYLLKHPSVLVHQPAARIDGVSFADPEHAAALWEVCGAPDLPTGACQGVVTWTSNGWQTSQAKLIPDKLSIYAVPDGSVVVWLYGAHSLLEEPDGSTRKLVTSSQPVAAPPGGSLVNLPSAGGAPAAMLDTTTATVHRPLSPPTTRCVYDDRWDGHGRIWEYGGAPCGPAHLTVTWSSDLGKSWSSHHTGPAPILGLAVGPSRTAVLLGGQRHAGRGTLQAMDITDDGGATWRRVPVAGVTLAGGVYHRLVPYSIATTEWGQLYLADAAGLFSATPGWTAFHRVRSVLPTDDQVTSGPGVVCAFGGSASTVRVSTDRGRSWRSVSPRP